MLRSDFNFELPLELIANFPSPERTKCRMLCLDGNSGDYQDKTFIDLKSLLSPGDLLVLNNTRVIPARMYGHKDTGGKTELLIERILAPKEALVHIKSSKAPREGQVLIVGRSYEDVSYRVVVLGRQGELFHIRLLGHQTLDNAIEQKEATRAARTATITPEHQARHEAKGKIALDKNAQAQGATALVKDSTDTWQPDANCPDLLTILEEVGHIPLPPYIQRPDEFSDKERYQTVYAKEPGAVAAPTAGLHFDEAQLDDLRAYGVKIVFVTLHVGAGTFQPVREDDILKHHMHSEYVELSAEVANAVKETHRQGKRVIAVGTTAVRSLESAAQAALKEGQGEEIIPFYNDTSIFIYPGYKYRVVDALITNFHLPESTLIMLVSAFAGFKNTMQAYAHAVKERYHFFSYGDCMFITKRTQEIDLPPSGAAVPASAE